MTDNKLNYFGEIKVPNGKYLKDGVEKTSYHAIGKVFESGENRLAIMLYPSAYSTEPVWLNAYKEDRKETKTDTVAEVTDDPIDLSNIPF